MEHASRSSTRCLLLLTYRSPFHDRDPRPMRIQFHRSGILHINRRFSNTSNINHRLEAWRVIKARDMVCPMKTMSETQGRKRGKRAALPASGAGPDPLLVDIGSRIRAVREQADVAQEVCAAEIPMSRAHYGLVERGRTNVTIGTLAQIAATLDVGLDQLLPPLAEMKRLLRRGRGLPE